MIWMIAAAIPLYIVRFVLWLVVPPVADWRQDILHSRRWCRFGLHDLPSFSYQCRRGCGTTRDDFV